MYYFSMYIILMGFVGVIMLCIDKYKATHEKWRIKEKTLHILEFLGGVFLMLPAMYLIRHKCRKIQYYWITYTALIAWVVGIWYMSSKQIL
ncbi:MAG: DUF1294 domain-containing protein [Bacteroidales bacterium]|nr:DUF1294 domain-containing protein [Bacteroidales bacterium]